MNDKKLSKNEVKGQYKNPGNLAKRGNLHKLYATNKYDWYKWVFDHFDFPPNAKILELGCGLGTLWQNNADRIPEQWNVTLSDFSEEMLARIKQQLTDLKHPFDFRVVDAENIPYEDASFDVIIANALLYLVPNIESVLREIQRVLKPGGTFVASTSGSNYMVELENLLDTTNLPVHRNYTTYSFSLDNGAMLLAPYFQDIQLKRYDSSLVITEPEPLADHILSTNHALPVQEAQRVRKYFDDYFKTHNDLTLTIDTGLFIAKR